MKSFWKNKRVLVTGGSGFIGSHVVDILRKKGANVQIAQGDLRKPSVAIKETENIEVVLHLAAKVAGIQYNINHPVEMFESNIEMAKNVLKAAYKNGVDRVLLVSSACVYPRESHIPTKETQGFVGDPDPTNLGYGWSKRVIELLGRFYNQEYGLKVAIARPYNAYGPRDNFDPATSHVIPGIIKRVFDGENPLTIWGTGTQTRSFIYVADLAEGLLKLIEKYPIPDPVNLGSHEEVSIKKLTHLIIKLSKVKTSVLFDTAKPDGQPRRLPDSTKVKKKIQFTSQTSLINGLKKTIAWYKKQHLLSSPATKSRA